MSDAMRVFLAALASTPVAALMVVFFACFSETYVDVKEALQVFAFITALFVVLVLAVGGMYFVWTWAL